MVQVWVSIVFAVRAVAGPAPVPIQFAKSVAGRTVTVCLDGRQVKTTFAGKLAIRDRNQTLFSVCANVRSPISAGQFFQVRPLSSSRFGGNIGLAGNIVARWFASAQTADQCAGLQLAVWEAIEDGGQRANFAAGRFQGRANPAALAYAEQFFLAAAEPGEALYLQAGDGGGQSQVTTRL